MLEPLPSVPVWKQSLYALDHELVSITPPIPTNPYAPHTFTNLRSPYALDHELLSCFSYGAHLTLHANGNLTHFSVVQTCLHTTTKYFLVTY